MAYRFPGAVSEALAWLALAVATVAAGPVRAAEGAAGADDSRVFFRDVTGESGLHFTHDNGAQGQKNYYEVVGSGAALLDYDGDGRLDVYCVTSVGPNRLWRNLGGFRFEEVPGAAGAADEGYGMGAVAADIDNDGDPDLFVTNLGPNVLFLNDGDTFRPLPAGVEDPRWSSGAAFADYDLDGQLDLFVTNYVQVAVPDTNACPNVSGQPMYCGPRRYPRTKSALYRNLGGGAFRDVSIETGVAAVSGRGLGVVAFDADRDRRPDFYVANDLDPNFLFHNLENDTFDEIGVLAGVSHSENGLEESGMGIAVGDYDRDGWTDLFVTNYVAETNTIYRNERDGYFLDESAVTGLGPASLPWIGWGAEFVDYDLDGWPDLFLVNGHTESEPELADPTTTWKQRDFLFRNREGREFEDETAGAAPALLEPRAGRGAAFGDLDDDGDTDVVIIQQLGPALVLRNEGADGRRWIGVRTEGTESNRDGVGARVEVHAGGAVLVRERQAGGSYLSSNDPRLSFGLEGLADPDSVVVVWPSSRRDVWEGPTVGEYLTVREGAGERSLNR